MLAERTTYSGWNEYPVYMVRGYEDYLAMIGWMDKNECDMFLLSSGSSGYFFQVRKNHEWFALRWA